MSAVKYQGSLADITSVCYHHMHKLAGSRWPHRDTGKQAVMGSIQHKSRVPLHPQSYTLFTYLNPGPSALSSIKINTLIVVANKLQTNQAILQKLCIYSLTPTQGSPSLRSIQHLSSTSLQHFYKPQQPTHQKSARMNVCTISDTSTRTGHKPLPRACSRYLFPSSSCRIQWAQLKKRESPRQNT